MTIDIKEIRALCDEVEQLRAHLAEAEQTIEDLKAAQVTHYCAACEEREKKTERLVEALRDALELCEWMFPHALIRDQDRLREYIDADRQVLAEWEEK